MKLKEFNVENTIPIRGGDQSKPTIGINTKTGLFTFSLAATTLIGLGNGDQIVCHQDEDEQESWYLEKASSNGFVLRAKGNVTKGLLFNNTALARAIAGSVGMTAQSGKALIAHETVKHGKRILWTIVTAPLKKVAWKD